MKIKKIIAVDLDGTLLNKKEVLTPFTTKILKTLMEKGFLIVLASGRPFRAMNRFYKELGCQGPLICYNGSLCFNPSDSSFPAIKLTFPYLEILKFYNEVDPFLLKFEVESETTLYQKEEDPYLNAYFPEKDMKVIKGGINESLKEDVYTVLMKSEHSSIEAIEKAASKLKGIKYRHWHKSLYSELYVDGANKGNCLRHIMKVYGIDKSDVIAFGDSSNDIDMLEAAGKGYAMKNSHCEEMKKRFEITEFGYEDDGLAKTLSKLFL